MSQARNHLQAVSPTGTSHQHAMVTNQLVKQYNRQDTDTFAPIYAADTGTATAYAITPVPGIKFYVVGQIFEFKAANANTTGAPTLNVNGFGSGTITYPDGSALIPGDIAANGFYTVKVTTLTPTFQLSDAGGRSKLLQTVSVIASTVATGTTTVPFDNTIPQNTEGDQYMSLAITPKSATSKLVIDVTLYVTNSAVVQQIVTLCQDSTANSLAAVSTAVLSGGAPVTIPLKWIMTSGTTSATTFKVRSGGSVAGTTTINGSGGSQAFGGVAASSIVIQEVLP